MRQPNLTKLWVAAVVTLLLASYPSDLSYAGGVSAADQQKRRQAIASSDHLIVPGERIGPIRLGMGMDQVMATLGRPDSMAAGPTDMNGKRLAGDNWSYTDLNLRVHFSLGAAPSVQIVQTLANSDRKNWTYGTVTWPDFKPVTTVFRTDSGIRLGSSSFEVKRALSSYSYQDEGGIMMRYESLGIEFVVTRDFRVWMIIVRSPSSAR